MTNLKDFDAEAILTSIYNDKLNATLKLHLSNGVVTYGVMISNKETKSLNHYLFTNLKEAVKKYQKFTI